MWAVVLGLGLLVGAVVGLRRRRSVLGGGVLGGGGSGPFGPRSPPHGPYQGVYVYIFVRSAASSPTAIRYYG